MKSEKSLQKSPAGRIHLNSPHSEPYLQRYDIEKSLVPKIDCLREKLRKRKTENESQTVKVETLEIAFSDLQLIHGAGRLGNCAW